MVLSGSPIDAKEAMSRVNKIRVGLSKTLGSDSKLDRASEVWLYQYKTPMVGMAVLRAISRKP